MPPRTGAVFWSGLEAGCAGALSFVSAFVIARLIGPAELGIGAAAVASHVLLWVAVNALFADAITQRATLDQEAASSAFWASIAAGGIAALAQASLGALLAGSLADPRLPAMGIVLALPLPLVGAGGAVQGMLTRRRCYRALAGRTIIGQGIGTVIGIGLALDGAGAWAVVAQQAAGSGFGAACLLLRADWRPSLCVRLAPLRQMLAVGLPLAAATLVQHGRYRVFALAIGDIAGPAALGQVHLAFRLVDTVRDLAATALWRLMLPGLAERQHDRPCLCRAVDRLLALTGVVMFPLWGSLALTAGPLVALLLGPVWAASASAALPLIGLAAWLSLGFPAGVAAVARGKTGYMLAANLVATALTVGGAILLRPASPQEAVVIWVAAQLATAPYVLVMTGRALRQGTLRPLRAGLMSCALAAGATTAAFAATMLPGAPTSPLPLAALRLGLVAALFIPAAAWLLRADLRSALQAAGLMGRSEGVGWVSTHHRRRWLRWRVKTRPT